MRALLMLATEAETVPSLKVAETILLVAAPFTETRTSEWFTGILVLKLWPKDPGL